MTPVRTVVRFKWHQGKLHEDRYRVLRCTSKGRLVFPRDCPPEALFNGLNPGRLGQFHFQPPSSAVMLVGLEEPDPPIVWDGVQHETVTPIIDKWYFLDRIHRLTRKGVLVEQPEEKKVELSVVHTSCRDCVFAEFNQPGKANTQTGCELGRLDKFREQGTEVIEAYNGQDEFFVVNGRACTAFRSIKSDQYHNVPPDNRAAAVRAELTVRVDVLVPVMYDGPNLERLTDTLESLKRQRVKPSSVVVLNNADGVKTSSLIVFLRKAAEGLNWTVTEVKERKSDGSRQNVDRVVDLVAGNLKGHFYTLLSPGDTLPETFTEDLDKAVVDDMARFVALTPNKDGVGQAVALGFHRAPMVNGNKGIPAASLDEDYDERNGYATILLTSALQKAQYLAATRNLPHLVETAENVCKSLS